MAIPTDLSKRRGPLPEPGMSSPPTRVFQPFRAPARPGATVFNLAISGPTVRNAVPHERAHDHRGHIAHAHCARPVEGISLWRLWLRSVCPCSRSRTRGGVSDGSDPPFTCLVRPWTPFCLRTSGVLGPPSPRGGRSRLNDPCRKARIPEACAR